MTNTMFSHSILNDARKCLRLYELKHIRKVEVKQPLSGDLEFGTAFHLGLHDILSEDTDGIQIFETYWETLKNKQVEWGRFAYESLYDQATVLYRKFKRLHARHFSSVRLEERLSFKLPSGNTLEGTPDAVGLYRGESAIVDFKTSGYNYPQEKLLCEEQLSLYSELESRVSGFKAKKKAYLVFKKDYKDPSIQTLVAPLTNTRAVWDNAASLCDDLVSRRVFQKNPSSCIMGGRKCPYFEMCWGKNEQGC